MIKKLTIKLRKPYTIAIFHDTRGDIQILMKANNQMIDKINELTDEINKAQNKIEKIINCL